MDSDQGADWNGKIRDENNHNRFPLVPPRLPRRLVAAMSMGAVEPIDPPSGVMPKNESPMSHSVSAPSHPSQFPVRQIEHAGVRYEQDMARQCQPDAERGGWLVAKDAASGAQLWSVRLCADPYDAGSAVGSPPRWFRGMQLIAGGAAIEIEDDTGTRFLVDRASRTVTIRHSPLSRPGERGGDNRPKLD